MRNFRRNKLNESVSNNVVNQIYNIAKECYDEIKETGYCGDMSTYFFDNILPEPFILAVGWLPGYDPADFELLGSIVTQDGWGLNVGCKVYSYGNDYESMNMPYYDDGNVDDLEVTLTVNKKDIKSSIEYIVNSCKYYEDSIILNDGKVINLTLDTLITDDILDSNDASDKLQEFIANNIKTEWSKGNMNYKVTVYGDELYKQTIYPDGDYDREDFDYYDWLSGKTIKQFLKDIGVPLRR